MQVRDWSSSTGSSVNFRIFTPEGRYALTSRIAGGRTVTDFYPLGRGGSTVFVSDDGAVTITAGEEPKPCRTVRARYDVAADTMTASVPTSCLGSPTWVQVAAGVSRDRITPQGDGSVNLASYADDAFRAVSASGAWAAARRSAAADHHRPRPERDPS